MEVAVGRNDNNRRIEMVQEAIKASGVSPVAVAQIVIDSILGTSDETMFQAMLDRTISMATEIQRQIDAVEESESDRAEKVAAALNAPTKAEAERLCGFLSQQDALTVLNLRRVAEDMLPPGERPWDKTEEVENLPRKANKVGAIRAAMRQMEETECDCAECTARKAGTLLIKPSVIGEA